MAEENLKIKIGGDVTQAIAAVQQLAAVTTVSTQSVAKSFEKVESSAFDVDKAIKQAMDRVGASVDSNIDKAIASFNELEKEIVSSSASAGKAVKSLQDKFQAFGGITGNTAAKSIDQFLGKTKALPPTFNQATTSLTNFSRVVQDAPFGIIGVANNIDPLIQSFISLRKETGSAKAAFSALGSSLIGGGGLALAVSLVTSGLVLFAQSKQKAASEAKKLKEEENIFVDTLAKEKVQLDNLFKIATSANVPLKARIEAVKELRSNYGEYLKNFSDEEILAGKAADAYNRLAAALINVARAKAAEGKQIELSKKVLDNEEKIAAIREKAQREAANAKDFTQQISGGTLGTSTSIRVTAADQQNAIFSKARKETELLRVENKGYTDEINRLADVILKNQVEPLKIAKKETKEIKKEVLETAAALNGLLVGLNDSFEKTNLKLQEASKLFNPTDFGKLPKEATAGQDGVIVSQEQQIKNQERLNFLIKSVNYDKQREQLEQLSLILENGLNAGIDTFFNTLANNQDPFAAVIQSAKRLVAELASAVVKAFVLRAITSGISGGASGGAGLLSGIVGSKGVVRADQLRVLTFLRG